MDSCPYCGKNALELTKSTEILQQVELPKEPALVTEYARKKYVCKYCGKKSKAPLPKGVPNTVFGPKMMGLLATLTGEFHLAKRESKQLIKDLYDIDISLGSVSNIEERVSNALDTKYQQIHAFVIKSKLSKHFDETGWRNSGKNQYVWTACTNQASFFHINPKRNREAFNKIVGDNKFFSAVTDRYNVYKIIKGHHQYCLAHLVRNFQYYAERASPDDKIGEAISNHLLKILKTHAKYREGKRNKQSRNISLGHARKHLELLFIDGLANGSDSLSKLCEKLLDELEHIFAFTKVEGMEPTNNLAERNLRKIVIWRKKSYGTRSVRGQRFVERITSIAQTVRRQGKNVLSFIQEATMSYYSKSEAPFICPQMGY